jgi:hypothetical protein
MSDVQPMRPRSGDSVKTALNAFFWAFQHPVEKTLFGTEHSIESTLNSLSHHLSDPITSEQAVALCDAIEKRAPLDTLIDWLARSNCPWSFILDLQNRKKRSEEAYMRELKEIVQQLQMEVSRQIQPAKQTVALSDAIEDHIPVDTGIDQLAVSKCYSSFFLELEISIGRVEEAYKWERMQIEHLYQMVLSWQLQLAEQTEALCDALEKRAPVDTAIDWLAGSRCYSSIFLELQNRIKIAEDAYMRERKEIEQVRQMEESRQLQIANVGTFEGGLIAGVPVLWVPDKVREYPDFLTWWMKMGRLNPTDPQGWSSLSGPGVMWGRSEIIHPEVWSTLPLEERELITAWAKTLGVGMFYD